MMRRPVRAMAAPPTLTASDVVPPWRPRRNRRGKSPMKNVITRVGFAIALGLIAATTADAGMITYMQTVNGSGSLGGTAYVNALVTFTQTADTADVASLGTVSSVQAVTSTVSVAGFGSGS